MRIIFDHSIFTQQVYGGVSRYFYELSKELSTMQEVTAEIVAPLYVNEYINKSDNNVFGFKASGFPKAARMSMLVNDMFGPVVSSLKKPNIYHETYYAGGSKKFSGCKNVLTVYDMIHELYPESYRYSDNTSELKRRAVERADHVICISDNTKKDLMDLFDVPEEKTSVIHLGFKLKNKSLSERVGDHIDSPYLLYVGNRGGYKNFSTLLEAYATSNIIADGCKLICFGGGSFTLKEQDSIKKSRVESDSVIQISGDDSTLANLYSKAKVFVYPSLYEGFGIPPLEAMSYGCPVICSNSSSMPEVVGSAAELFDPTNVESLLAAIERVFYANDYSSKLIELGYKQIKEFSWNRCAKETLEIYRSLV